MYSSGVPLTTHATESCVDCYGGRIAAAAQSGIMAERDAVETAQNAQTLEHRLRGVGQIVDQLEEAQSDPDFAAKYLLRTDPADAISAVEERLTSAEERYNRKICAMKQAISRPAWKM